jgi:hypothetical protein
VLVRPLAESVKGVMEADHAFYALSPTTISESPKRSLRWMRPGYLRCDEHLLPTAHTKPWC